MAPLTKKSTLKLKNKIKIKIPVIGFDTTIGIDNPSEIKAAVEKAIDAGYLLFLCDSTNGEHVGEVLKEKIGAQIVEREKLFIVVKVYWQAGEADNYISESVKKSLQDLGLSYVDLLVFHCPNRKMDLAKTWEEMETCFNDQLTKAIGFFNFPRIKIDPILEMATVKPLVNILDSDSLINRKDLRKFHQDRKIALMAVKPYGSINRVFIHANPEQESEHQEIFKKSEKIRNLAIKYRKTNCQLALRYLISHDIIPFVKIETPGSIEKNIDIFDFQLTDKEVKSIDKEDNGPDGSPSTCRIYSEELGYI